MPSTEVNSPASSAPIDRIALGVGWVRPGVGSIGGALNPSAASSSGWNWGRCFEGNEE